MRKILTILILLITAFCIIPKAEAKWWIFGQGSDGININYLYLNKSSYDESGSNLVLYKDSLFNGNVTINGKATVRNSKIGAVYVTLDNQKTWEKAKLSNNGTFQYTFNPELAKDYYLFIKIIDTTGKTNDIVQTYKKITVIDENISQLVRETLDKITRSYENEEQNLFMSYVSPDFAGDEAVLNTAIRKDFNAFDYIKLDFYINNVSKSSNGKVYLAVQYNRTVVSSRSGQTYTDNGNTEIIFNNEEGKFKIFSMKNPLMFGLSDAGNVATGTIQSTNNDPIILVDESGNVDEKPFRTAIDIIENGSDGGSGSAGVESGTVIVAEGPVNINGYTFTYLPMMPNELQAPALANVKTLGSTDIDSVNSVSVGAGDNDFIMLIPGESAAVKFSDGKYMLVEHVSGAGVGSVVKYRFQPNGSSSF